MIDTAHITSTSPAVRVASVEVDLTRRAVDGVCVAEVHFRDGEVESQTFDSQFQMDVWTERIRPMIRASVTVKQVLLIGLLGTEVMTPE